MESINILNITNTLIKRSKELRGNYAVFCVKTGIDRSWFSKFTNGHITNPTIKSLVSLEKALNSWNKEINKSTLPPL